MKNLNYYLKRTTKIVGIGINYVSYIERNHFSPPTKPVLFLKPTSSIIESDCDIIYPSQTSQLEFEAELGVVIYKKAHNINIANWREYVAGYTCVNDVTARDLQSISSQWTESKSFDTFCPIGPKLVEIDAENLAIKCYVNDEIKQDDVTSNMIFKIPGLLTFVSQVMTLNEGDIISTGTPAGSCPVNKGDKVVVDIEGIGQLINHIK